MPLASTDRPQLTLFLISYTADTISVTSLLRKVMDGLSIIAVVPITCYLYLILLIRD